MQKTQVSISHDSRLLLIGQDKPFSLFQIHNTTFLICSQPLHTPNRILTLSDGTQNYMCGFYKFINLQLVKKVTTLIRNIINGKSIRQWPALYEVLTMTPRELRPYRISDISYGEEVLLELNADKQLSYQDRVVSNCFNQNGDFFYFLQNQHENYQAKQFGTILSKDKQQIYGLCLILNQTYLYCLPFNLIFNTEKTVLKIEPSVVSLLKKTVYLQVQGNHSTGTLIEKDKILTVRHAFGSTPEKGAEINVKIYPYQQTHKAILISQLDQLLDAVILHLINPQEFLEVHQINSQSFLPDFPLQTKKTVKIGQKIRALGFGKYSYFFGTFKNVHLLLPTIMTGVISKTLTVDSEIVIFKTDASLYNGFSGCSIWCDDSQLGMAVFCIKNVSNYSHLYRQNFSYVFDFIKSYLRGHKQSRKLKQFLGNIDQFTMRKTIDIRSRL